jgi:hypothetical protein
MAVQCIACQRCALRDAGKMAPLGLAPCTRGPRWTFHPVLADRECPHYTPAPADTVGKRRAWLGAKLGPNESTQ